MTQLSLDLKGATVVTGGHEMPDSALSLADGLITDTPAGRAVDLRGYVVLPGIVDLHGDGFERHLAPRRGAMKQKGEGLIATEAELAANGVTTAVVAQFWSWEGGLRGPDYAAEVFAAIARVKGMLVTELIPQLRFETHMLDDYDRVVEFVGTWDVPYLVFNDHLPHKQLAAGKKPPRLVGQALKAARNPDAHHAMLRQMHEQRGEVPAALDRMCAQLSDSGIRLGSHDDHTAQDRKAWRTRGVRIAEFPETLEAAEEARAGGDAIILGAPNAVRGGSHKGNASALDLIAMGLCDALASDYHYPSPRRAALMLAQSGLLSLGAAWQLVSEGPAKVLGLNDRGRLQPGQRADLVILDAETRRVAATLVQGRFSYLSGDIARRFIAS